MWETICVGEILITLLVSGVIFALSTVLHEFAHLVMCKVFGCRVVGLKVLCFYFDGHKWSVRFKGKNHCAFVSDDKKKMRLIVAAGPLTEMLITVILLVLGMMQHGGTRISFLFSSLLIGVSIIFNLLPNGNGDGRMLFKGD